MNPYIDQSVYPDLDSPPETLDSDEQRADYVERVCAAWDFDVFPERETFDMFRGWKTIFDGFPLPCSPAYHTFRRLYSWPDIPFPLHAIIRTPTYEILDRAEGREPDCCVDMV